MFENSYVHGNEIIKLEILQKISLKLIMKTRICTVLIKAQMTFISMHIHIINCKLFMQNLFSQLRNEFSIDVKFINNSVYIKITDFFFCINFTITFL